MRILYITCALLAITVGCFAADNTAVNPSDKAANQQSIPVTEATTPAKHDTDKNEETTTAQPKTSEPITKPTIATKATTLPSPTGTTSHPNVNPGNATVPVVPDNKNATTIPPTTTVKPTNPTTQETTTKSAKTTAQPPNVTTTNAPNATEAHSTTAIPQTTMSSSPSPSKERQFDGLSFIGGMILTLGLLCLGAFSWKLYKDRRDGHYRTL